MKYMYKNIFNMNKCKYYITMQYKLIQIIIQYVAKINTYNNSTIAENLNIIIK